MTINKPNFKYAVCVDNDDYEASLELWKIYIVLPDEKGDEVGYLRIIDESGEDYLYPANYFVAIDPPQKVKDLLLVAA